MTIKWQPASAEELAQRVSAPQPEAKPASKPTKKAAAKSEE